MVNIERFWRQSQALTIAAAFFLLDFLCSLLGLALDPRIVGGAPVWLKPAKFGISTAIFAASVAWMFEYMPGFAKAKRWVAPTIAFILLLEIAIIDFQAARGVTSHFNVSTVENSVLYSVMGTAIGILWLLTIYTTVALFRQRFKDESWGWALRLGLLISVLGSASGGLMTLPTKEQRLEMMERKPVTVVGAHTVGARDGEPGIAGTGWSKEHGDLRISHFIGLHALQVIPFLAWWRGRKRTTRFVMATAGSYFTFYVILTWQALRGESITEPGSLTLLVLGVWLAATMLALLSPGRARRGKYAMEVALER